MRRLISIQEVQGLEGEIITLSEIFNFQRRGMDKGGEVLGVEGAGVKAVGQRIPIAEGGAGPSTRLGTGPSTGLGRSSAGDVGGAEGRVGAAHGPGTAAGDFTVGFVGVSGHDAPMHGSLFRVRQVHVRLSVKPRVIRDIHDETR